MSEGFWQGLDLWARRALPAGISLALVLLAAVPLPMLGYSSIVPMLALASVFFWAVHQPRLLPPIVVFAVGLAHDALSGVPMGAGTVVFLVVYGAVEYQRRFFVNRSFFQVWTGFAVMAFFAMVLGWLLAIILVGVFAPPRAAMFQYLLTIAIYPLVSWPLHGAERLVAAET